MQQPESLDAPVSSGQLLRCLSTVLSLFLNDGIASNAVFAAAQSLGVSEEELLNYLPALTRSKIQGNVKKEPGEGKKEKKERKPHKLSMFNIFMAKMMLQQKLADEANGGATATDAKNRLQRCSMIWKTMPDAEKEKFKVQYGPLADQLNAKMHAGQAKPENLHQEIADYDAAQGLPTHIVIAAPKSAGKPSASKSERPQRQAASLPVSEQNGRAGDSVKTKKGKKGAADVPATPDASAAQKESKSKKRGADDLDTPKSAAGKDEKSKKAKKGDEEVAATTVSESSKKKKKKKKKKESEAA